MTWIKDDPMEEARRLIQEVVYSHAHRSDKDGYFSDPHVYNECDQSECLWCEWAKQFLERTAPTSTEERK